MSSIRRDFSLQRNETLIIPVMSTWVDSAATNYDIEVPLGCYFLELLATIADTAGPTTAVIGLYPFLDADRTTVGAALSLRAIDGAASGTTFAIATTGATPIGYAVEANLNSAVGKRMPLSIPFGLRMTWNKGNTTAGTTINIKLVAARDA